MTFSKPISRNYSWASSVVSFCFACLRLEEGSSSSAEICILGV
jgi:hypothetical protein